MTNTGVARKGYLKGLNELRAIAALSVVIYHIGKGLPEYGLKAIENFDMGTFGVTIFFALSGFLITYLLLLERDKVGDIRIKDFYMRRILRIWPLYFFYLVITVIAVVLTSDDFKLTNLLYYFLIIPNLVFPFKISFPFLYHYWSLGVEENFYLFWPLFIRNTKHLLRKLIFFLAMIMLSRVILKIISVYAHNDHIYEFSIYNRIDCMVIGAIAAYIYYTGMSGMMSVITSKYTQVAALLIFGLILVNRFMLPTFISHDLCAMATAVVIINTVDNPKKILRFENGYFDFIGRISFGIYVYHPLVIYLIGKYCKEIFFYFHFNSVILVSLIYLVNCLATVFIAYISYNYFEKYFLNLKTKYSPLKPQLA